MYLTSYLAVGDSDAELHGGAAPSRTSKAYLQDAMRELGVLAALITLLTVPFERLGTVARHKLGIKKKELSVNRLKALWCALDAGTCALGNSPPTRSRTC